MSNLIYSLLIICYLLSTAASAQIYSADKINPEMKSGANAVIRKHDIQFEVKNEKTAVLKEVLAVTIFTKNEKHYGEKVLWYDKFKDIDTFEGKLFDEHGKLIRQLDKKEISDYSAFSDYSLYEDTRVKVAELYYDKVPYTIEFTVEVELDGYISWPTWYSRRNIDPVEQTKFQVTVPKNHNLRYWCNRDSVKPEITSDSYNRFYTWEIFNQPPLSRDAIGDEIEDIAAIVMVAPDLFEIDGYTGNMSSWNKLGKWIFRLFSEKSAKPQQLVSLVPSLIADASSDMERTAILYKYLQTKTRYVSVQLGIGGWQPFDAAYVHERGYGDCKALTNYMITLLDIAGIKAYPVVINNGSDRYPMIEEFPSNQFNHVIACVPFDNDTVWLECTSQTISFGSIGWSNENRGALLISPEGGVVVKTPVSSHTDNVRSSRTTAKITGRNLEGFSSIKWTGNLTDNVRHVALQSSPKDQVSWITSLSDQKGLNVIRYVFENADDLSKNISLDLTFTLTAYVNSTGNRIFINPNVYDKVTSVPKEVQERLSPVRYKFPNSKIDTLIYTIPAGYNVESLPKQISLSTEFGEFYSNTLHNDDGTIEYVRRLDIKDYLIPADNYNEYRNFMMEVARNDRSQIVLVKK